MKIDPLAVRYEARPGTGAILTDIPEKKWKDGLWLARRKRLSKVTHKLIAPTQT